MADPEYHDPKIAGWWIWGMSCWIGGGFAAGNGPWTIGADGRITKQTGSGGAQRKRPHLADNGQGVNRPQGREPGVKRQLPHLTGSRGVNTVREQGVATGAGTWDADDDSALIIPDDLVFHERTMPEVKRWFAFLSARLRHVRICNGDWRRVVTSGAAFTLPVRQGDGPCGVFLDPPYAASANRASDLYAHDDEEVSHEAREWAIDHGDDKRLRIVFAGYDGEHGDAFEAAGWRTIEWFKDGWLRGGMGNQGENGHQQDRERLWASPHCLKVELRDLPMFADWSDDE